MTFSFDGHEFADDAPERALLHDDGDGNAAWRVACGDGYYEVTDDGLRDMRAARNAAMRDETEPQL